MTIQNPARMATNSPPEVEYDDSANGSLTLSWYSALYKQSFSIVIMDGCLVGVHSSENKSERFEPWKVELPKGLVKIDCNAMKAIEQIVGGKISDGK